jgi:hypothetical protein
MTKMHGVNNVKLKKQQIFGCLFGICIWADEFMILTSGPRRVWLFGYTLCGRFVPTENLNKF